MTLTSDEQTLRDQPLDFLKRHSVSPTDGNFSILSDQGEVTTSWGEATHKYEHRSAVNPACKIGYGKLTKLARSTIKTNPNSPILRYHLEKSGAHFLSVKLKHELTDSAANYVPFYWLPWRSGSGGVVSISLIVPPPRRGQEPTPDPDLFFTAALSGCSIFVRGNRQHPIVYHAGSDGTPPGSPGQNWRKLFRSIVPVNEYASRAYSEVNTMNYMDKKAHRHTDVEAYQKYLEQHQKEEITVESIRTWGCVFGIRDNGDWSFYYQQNVGVEYWKMRRTKFLKRHTKAEPETRTVHRPMYVTQFYPGRAHVHITDFDRISVR